MLFLLIISCYALSNSQHLYSYTRQCIKAVRPSYMPLKQDFKNNNIATILYRRVHKATLTVSHYVICKLCYLAGCYVKQYRCEWVELFLYRSYLQTWPWWFYKFSSYIWLFIIPRLCHNWNQVSCEWQTRCDLHH